MTSALANPLLLVLSAVVFFCWFGGVTGYASGWAMYWFGMNYPLRFLLDDEGRRQLLASSGAVAEDRPGGLVVQGPPGTGKSQLIANLVAFMYMVIKDIGLDVNVLPVSAVGIGVGVMMAPGVLGIVTDAAGLFLISVAPIPAMERFAIFCGFWKILPMIASG